jgi:hypothetical protein
MHRHTYRTTTNSIFGRFLLFLWCWDLQSLILLRSEINLWCKEEDNERQMRIFGSMLFESTSVLCFTQVYLKSVQSERNLASEFWKSLLRMISYLLLSGVGLPWVMVGHRQYRKYNNWSNNCPFHEMIPSEQLQARNKDRKNIPLFASWQTSLFVNEHHLLQWHLENRFIHEEVLCSRSRFGSQGKHWPVVSETEQQPQRRLRKDCSRRESTSVLVFIVNMFSQEKNVRPKEA